MHDLDERIVVEVEAEGVDDLGDRVDEDEALDAVEVAFLPGSQIALRPVRDRERLVGEVLDLRVIKSTSEIVVVSRRVLLEEERAPLRQATMRTLEVGQVVTGVVAQVTDWGGFIDLGGIDAVLTLTNLSYSWRTHPSAILTEGEPVEVMVLKIDRECMRAVVGTKQLRAFATHYPLGSQVQGSVVSLPDYGVFVELEAEGLVHVSEMPEGRKPKLGEVVTARVLRGDVEGERISLGLKE